MTQVLMWDRGFIPCIVSSVGQWLLSVERPPSFSTWFPLSVTGAFPAGLGRGSHGVPALSLPLPLYFLLSLLPLASVLIEPLDVPRAQ